MVTSIQKYLPVIDSKSNSWLEDAEACMKQGRNYLLLLPPEKSVVREFASRFQLAPEQLPQPLQQSDLAEISPYVHPCDFDLLVENLNATILFIKQLDLPTTRPPQFKGWIVYCGLRGIISQHENPLSARTGCLDYFNKLLLLRQKIQAGLFYWGGQAWKTNMNWKARTTDPQLARLAA